VLAHLGLAKDRPFCADVVTRPKLESVGIKVLDAPFYAEGNVASAGGCLSGQYLATWIIWRLLGKQAALDALIYVMPVGQEEEYISRAVDAVSPYIETDQALVRESNVA
jgi:hypothetical protein